MNNRPYRMDFLNTYIDNITSAEAIAEVERLVDSGGPSYIVTPNSDIVVQMQDDVELKVICEAADLVLTDGMVLIRISERLGNPIKERVCMTDFVWDIVHLAAVKNYRVFMLGGKPDVLARAKVNLENAVEGLNVVGSYSPRLGFEKDDALYHEVLEEIRYCKPDILLVFLGCPKQEKFIARSLKELNVPLSIPMGGCVDFLAGDVRRAPKWMQDRGLEWFYRFVQDPRRLFKRYFIDDMKIFKLFWRYRKMR